MRDALAEFHRTLNKSGIGLFYYAGHGVQVKGENFLVPVQAKLREEYEVSRQCVEVGEVLTAMADAEHNLKIVVLDCCRNNPFARSWTRSTATGGLAPISAPKGTIVAFATAPGETAEDGGGVNSPYTEQLVAALRDRPEHGLEIIGVFRKAGQAVGRVTRQAPWMNWDTTLGDYFLWNEQIAGSLTNKPGTNVTNTSASKDQPEGASYPHEVLHSFESQY